MKMLHWVFCRTFNKYWKWMNKYINFLGCFRRNQKQMIWPWTTLLFLCKLNTASVFSIHISPRCHFWSDSSLLWEREQPLTHLHHLKQGRGLDTWSDTFTYKSLCLPLPGSHCWSWWGGCSCLLRCLRPFSARRHLRGKWACECLSLLNEV